MPKIIQSSNNLYPFFCYFGGKWRVAKHYQKPRYDKIIEPFCGAAGYSTRYHYLDINLYDIDDTIFGLWDYLIHVSESEILSLPLKIDHVDSLDVCEEAKSLIGFWINKASARPYKTPTSWMISGVRPNSHWGEAIRFRISQQVKKIRHWKVFNESYNDIDNEECTWFIDPPYQGACGRLYKHKIDDYFSLASYCKERKGQVIVCEREGANWLPFKEFRTIKSTEGSKGKSKSIEVVWEN